MKALPMRWPNISRGCAIMANKTKPIDIALLIDDQAVLPLQASSTALDWLAETFRTIKDIVSAPMRTSDGHNDHVIAMMRVRTLADMGMVMAEDYSNRADCAAEAMQEEHKPAIIDALGGSHD